MSLKNIRLIFQEHGLTGWIDIAPDVNFLSLEQQKAIFLKAANDIHMAIMEELSLQSIEGVPYDT